VARPALSPAAVWAAAAPSARRAAIEAASPDVFAALPPRDGMLPGLASPCWRDARGATRCLPALHILGVS
jgi:hypothetical protein